MSATVNDKRRRNDTNNQNPLQSINASVGYARSAGLQGYSGFEHNLDGSIKSAMSPSGVRVDFTQTGGMSPEDFHTQRVRAQLSTQGTAAAAPATNPAPTVGNRPTAAAIALDRPTDASVALNRPTDASVALNGPAGAPAASRGPLYDPRNPPQTMRLAGTAADASSAMKQVAQNPGAFTGTTGYGKLGQVAAPAPANTNLTGTSAVPYTDPATGKTQVGFVTVGNPNAPDPLAGVGGTGEVRNGIPLQKDAKGNFVPAVSGPPLPPPKALDLPSSPGASGPTYDPANPPSLDRASQQAIVAQYPEVGNAGSWANTAFKAGLKPGQNTAADAQNTLDRLTKPDPAPTPAPAIAQNPTLPTPSFGSIPGPMYKFPQPLPGDTAAKQTPDAPAFNLGTGAPAAAPLLPTAPTANSRGGFGGFQQGVDNAVAGISNLGPTTTVGDLQGPAQHGSFMNVIRSVTGAFTSPPPDQTVGAATTGAPGTATNIAKNNNLGSPDTSFQRTAPSGLTTNNTSATPTVAGGPTTPNATPAQGLTSGGSLDSATSTVAGGPVTPNARPAQGLTSGGGLGAATSTVAGGPTTPNAQPAQGLTSGGSMDAATPTVAGGATTPNARPAQGLTAGGSLDAATPTVAGGATTPNAKPAQGLTTGTLGNSGGLTSGSLTSTAGSALASAPTAGDALAGAPSAADSLNAASLYHPAKFSGDPAAATNPFGTAQPLTLGSTVSTDGMYHGGFPGVGGAPANPLGGNAAAPTTLDPDELLRRKAAMLPAGTTGSFSNAPKTS